MFKNNYKWLLISVMAILGGCNGFDKTYVVIHPDEVPPAAVFDVALVNVYTLVDSGSTISATITRDSLHLLVGLPQSWNIISATMAIAEDFSTEKLLATQNDLVDNGGAGTAELLQQYQRLAVSLPLDEALSTQISGDTISAHGRNSNSGDHKVIADQVKTWKGFSAPVAILLNKGTRPDSLLPFDTALNYALETGLVESSTVTTLKSLQNNPLLSALVPDTLGLTMVPVVVFLKVQASSVEGTDTIYYFSKTGMMHPKPSSAVIMASTLSPGMVPQLSALEYGDMTYIPVTISNSASTVKARTLSSRSPVRVMIDRRGNICFKLSDFDVKTAGVAIYSLQGTFIASLGTNGSTSVIWNGTDHYGNGVQAGSYIAKITDSRNCVSTGISLVK